MDYDASAIEDLSTLLSPQVLRVGTNVKKGGGGWLLNLLEQTPPTFWARELVY